MPIREPMYASIGTSIPSGRGWVFEQKYDGMRVIAEATARRVRLVTRNGHDKRAQFPEIAAALRDLAARVGRSLVLDGEIVALKQGRPAAFQALQPRMQLKDLGSVEEKARTNPAALVLFDILYDGRTSLLRKPLRERRAHLEEVLRSEASPRLRLSRSSSNGRSMIEHARRGNWEGVIAKELDAAYAPGARTGSWLKLKLQHRAEFVVGGFTEPRRTREHIGAVLLGHYDKAGRFCYVGNMGGGFNRDSLRRMIDLLQPLERRTSPFTEDVRTAEPVHWVTPRIVVEVKFAEWTSDGKLRQPIFLGVRDDKPAREIRKERESVQQWAQEIGDAGQTGGAMATSTTRAKRSRSSSRTKTGRAAVAKVAGPARAIIEQLDDIESSGGDGELRFGRGRVLHVSSLSKPYFPEAGITKGDLMRYYAMVSRYLLPVVEDRPLILKRYPNGIAGPSFFQQNVTGDVPDVVRTATVTTEGGKRAERIIGGDLPTLLYMVQIGTIAVHAWQARLRTHRFADSTTIDLDPGDGVSFREVVALARVIKAQLDKLGLTGAIKTSGSSGLHIVLPLPPKTAFEDAAQVAERIAERVVEAQPKRATLERSIKARPAGTIYVDAQQNAEGKSVVAAYSVREKAKATVSAPLDWRELRPTLRLEAFTIDTMPKRLARLGDLWGAAMKRRNTARAIERVLRDA